MPQPRTGTKIEEWTERQGRGVGTAVDRPAGAREQFLAELGASQRRRWAALGRRPEKVQWGSSAGSVGALVRLLASRGGNREVAL